MEGQARAGPYLTAIVSSRNGLGFPPKNCPVTNFDAVVELAGAGAIAGQVGTACSVNTTWVS